MNATVQRRDVKVVTQTTTPSFVSVREVAVLYGVSRNHVYRAIRTGQLPAYDVFGALRIPKAALHRIKLVEPGED